MYTDDVLGGRPSIAPEKLLRAMLLQMLHSVRSRRVRIVVVPTAVDLSPAVGGMV